MIPASLRRVRDDERGEITLEVILLTVPVFVLLGFVVLVGRLGGADGDVGQAARDAARIGSLYTPARAQPEAAAAAQAALDGSATSCINLTVNLTTTGEPGTLATATVSCTVQVTEFPMLGGITKTVTETGTHPIDLWRAAP